MKKRVFIGIGSMILISLIALIVFMQQGNAITLLNNEITIEYGETLKEAKEYLNQEEMKSDVVSKTVLHLEDIPNENNKEYPAVGEYTVKLTYKDEIAEMKVTVLDTVKPVFVTDMKKEISTYKDVNIDFKDMFQAEDLSDVTVTVDDTTVNYSKAGQYKVKVSAIDAHENEEIAEVTILINEPTIKLDQSKVELYVKDSQQLKVTIKGKDNQVTYKSSDTSIADVSESGKITAKKKGSVTITASANGVEAKCKVTVKESPVQSAEKSNSQNNSQSHLQNNSHETTKPNTTVVSKNKVIVINAGHQGKGNSSTEPIGPGSSTKKAKVTTGATGVSSKKKESEITLAVAKKLKKELESRGYTVIMTRTSQNVNISNKERALIGNKYKAGAVISIHCDSTTNSSTRGAHTICIAKNNPYCPELYNASSSLASKVINAYCKETGIKSRGVSYRNDLTGLNWSEVPAIYIEMGFISNSQEDKLLTDSSFQDKCARGIANGIDQYF